MLHSTFLFSLLVSAITAQGLSLSIRLPADSALPSFALVTPGATIEPPSSRVSTVTPTPTPVDEDQPDPYNSSIQVPASESFNPSKAPAFTQQPGVPDISGGPVFSTPCSTEIIPTTTPCSTVTISTTVTASPIKAPTTKVPSNDKATPVLSSAAPPAQTPCDEEDKDSASPNKLSGTPLPISPTSIPTGGRPPYPIGSGFPTFIPRPSDRPAYGYGQPRPTGAWPSRARPTRAFGRPHKPSANAQLPPRPSADKENAASTPCTLETRVRPTPTAAVRRRAADMGAYTWWE